MFMVQSGDNVRSGGKLCYFKLFQFISIYSSLILFSQVISGYFSSSEIMR